MLPRDLNGHELEVDEDHVDENGCDSPHGYKYVEDVHDRHSHEPHHIAYSYDSGREYDDTAITALCGGESTP
jgi:hypothetical protein